MNIGLNRTSQLFQNQTNTKNKFNLSSSLIPIEKLGEGTYGSVYKVINSQTNTVYAIKVVKNFNNSEGVPTTSLREIILLKFLDHPNIVKLNDINMTSKHIELCLEYCQYDLLKFINLYKENKEIYTLHTIKNFLYQILTGVNYLHSKGVIHRDLKPGNIMINNNTLKIGDFGLSRIYSMHKKQYTKEVSTLWYRSPELLLGLEEYGIELDMWAIGCILGELLFKRPIFMGENELSQLNVLFEIYGLFDDDILPGFKYFPKYNSGFNQCKGIGLRKYFEENSKFKIDNVCFDLVEKLLKINPKERILSKEALEHVSFLIYLLILYRNFLMT